MSFSCDIKSRLLRQYALKASIICLLIQYYMGHTPSSELHSKYMMFLKSEVLSQMPLCLHISLLETRHHVCVGLTSAHADLVMSCGSHSVHSNSRSWQLIWTVTLYKLLSINSGVRDITHRVTLVGPRFEISSRFHLLRRSPRRWNQGVPKRRPTNITRWVMSQKTRINHSDQGERLKPVLSCRDTCRAGNFRRSSQSSWPISHVHPGR